MKNPEMDILQINSHHAHPIILSNVYFINGHNICMRRRALPIFLAIPPDFTYHDIWITHAFSMIEKIRLVHQILTYYRIHQTNTSGIPKSFSIFKRGFEIFQKSRGADFQEELQRYLACRKTVLSVVPLKEIPKESINFLHKKVAFCKWRFRLHSISLFCRIFCFNRDTINHYRKYTMNWKYSLLRDLFSLN